MQETEDSSSSNGQPWWVNPIYKFGIPSGICIFLVYFLAAQVKADLADIKEQMKSQQTIIRQNQQVLQVLQRICINSATTNQERNECFP